MGTYKRLFGKNGLEVTRIGLGGEGVLRTHSRTHEASAVIEMALAQGINYFDSARAYAGSEGYYGNFWQNTTVCGLISFRLSKALQETRKEPRKILFHALTSGLDQLDLGQMHDIRTY